MGKRQEFPKRVKLQAWERANGKCEGCGALLRPGSFDYDHTLPDTMGGEPTLDNCKVLCRGCHDQKTFKSDIPIIAKSNRVLARHAGIKRQSSRPLPGGRKSPWRKKMNGEVVPR